MVHVLTLWFVQEEAGRSQQGSQRGQYDRRHTYRRLYRPLHQEPLPWPEGRQTQLSLLQGPRGGGNLGGLSFQGVTQLSGWTEQSQGGFESDPREG